MSDRLTHLDENGKAVMVEVGEKTATSRTAIARGEVRMKESTLQLIMSGEVAKGDVWAVARVAGIMAAKKTPELIPLCHPLLLTSVTVDFTTFPGEGRVEIEAKVRVTGQTGVEMEALTAVAAAGLAIYDMCKAVDKEMVVSEIRLMEKHGGKSGTFLRQE
ncbi:MAG: cyclic pyranopterin monophosphate synthase MoaC [Pedobacter sp.]|jgi:cyclic pyranopterin phosphate synthase